jgi:hypothetical protein
MNIVDETQFSFSMLTNTAFHAKLSTLLHVKTIGHEIRLTVIFPVSDNVMKLTPFLVMKRQHILEAFPVESYLNLVRKDG